MKPLEQILSPAIMTKEGLDQNMSEQYTLLSEKINRFKMDIVINQHTHYPMDVVRPEIIDSWIRSYNYGLDLFHIFCPAIDPDALSQINLKKRQLMRVAAPYLHQLDSVFSRTRCFVMLTDEQGVILQVVGRNTKISRAYNLEPGVIWNERSIGTCSHGLSILYTMPIQIWGPEHYNRSFDQSTGSSAPIFDAFGNLAGTLTIGSDENFHQNIHTLGMVVSMAWAIQNEYQCALKDEVLSAICEADDEAVIIINNNSVIIQVNEKAQKMLNCSQSELSGQPLATIVGDQPLIKSVMDNGESLYHTELRIRGNKRINLCSAQPIQDKFGNKYGCVIRLRAINGVGKTLHPYPVQQIGSLAAFDNIIGSSDRVERIIERAKHIAATDVNILIQGESGTGKEVFAQAIHHSSRPAGQLVAVNCAAIPRSLIESELFGYESGAFTGAERNGKRGKIEMAHGGTLFLDEIGDMPLEVQPVLLRVLEEKQVTRLGSNQHIPVDFRLIAATNKDLLQLVNKNEFRQDLYYRLSVFKLSLPPLRERESDIIELAQHFISTTAAKLQIPAPSLSDAAKMELLEYAWPGNVRQLQNVILYAVHMSKDGVIWPEDLPDEINASAKSQNREEHGAKVNPLAKRRNLSIQEIEKLAITQSLYQTGNNVCETAKLLGLAKSTLYKKIKKYNLLDIRPDKHIK
ncbi:sigma-54-dependent Fis family transcriptional regulator [Sporomusa acidovorans]|uniref:Acetoin dehydrogenase operon transcriptional activator AcoR n=1 Tax=Sporomusa acidovorans (strain ATCC 49682 / DSM 3132 / Mol) TaxID=1123286 RepID=A0ABZ3JAT8_SPOA4|nr:sigma-54-dependent Fis family transcriptional regulator [Sporomusa acidovorans]OZC21762.1 acetoin dehydrogenase operon transcriptional activator AcoR [Sporomusa acidovorans DSM 3132]SDD57697.1 PAS domain S-box-containing protein [Sporomusa acidovorans]